MKTKILQAAALLICLCTVVQAQPQYAERKKHSPSSSDDAKPTAAPSVSSAPTFSPQPTAAPSVVPELTLFGFLLEVATIIENIFYGLFDLLRQLFA